MFQDTIFRYYEVLRFFSITHRRSLILPLAFNFVFAFIYTQTQILFYVAPFDLKKYLKKIKTFTLYSLKQSLDIYTVINYLIKSKIEILKLEYSEL